MKPPTRNRRRYFGPSGTVQTSLIKRVKRDQAGTSGTGRPSVRRQSGHQQTMETAFPDLPTDLAALLRDSPKRQSPQGFRPQLATLAVEVPKGERWMHELKFDGYRILARLNRRRNGQGVRLVSRRGNDWTDRFPSLASALDKCALSDTLIDGEVVVLDEHGRSAFQSLQNLMRRGSDADATYFAFDLPFFFGHDLTSWRLADRKRLLSFVLATLGNVLADRVRISDHIVGAGGDLARQACRHGLEGIVSKHADSPYFERRSAAWLKIKCLRRQEFVVGGWTNRSTVGPGVGALLLGVYDRDELLYCGRVGTGFNQSTQADLQDRLKQLASRDAPFSARSPGFHERGTHYLRPEMVVEVQFGEWTSAGILRHASFKGIREDKSAPQVRREVPKLGHGRSLSVRPDTTKSASKKLVRRSQKSKKLGRKSAS
jgi:bifunctional non-homologous end joining protein LigD